MIASKGDPNMYKQRGKSAGWAAFDKQQRQKDAGDSRVSNEPFPSLSGPVTLFENPERVSGNKQLPVKPFSSVVVPSVDFIAKSQNIKKNYKPEFGNFGGLGREISRVGNFDVVFRRLKVDYIWADSSLIEDIMTAVDNDFTKASSYLKAMMSDNVLKDHKRHDSVNNSGTLPGKNEISVQSLQGVSGSAKGGSSSELPAHNGNKAGMNNLTVHGENFSDNLIEINAMLGQLTCVPVEPEWEDDDVYLSCRKNAIKMMRAAARHSKAATNSFQRGDHYSAQQFSLKAQEEWESANWLNAKAAREILNIRNENNGIWMLDLHGLHASEAVQALQEHLHMIETQLYFKGSTSLNLPNTSSSSGGNKVENGGEQGLCRPNLKWLEVITGVGNHSRGGAALPTAVRSFLVDNGYRIDEARPGVIMVRPKFHFS